MSLWNSRRKNLFLYYLIKNTMPSQEAHSAQNTCRNVICWPVIIFIILAIIFLLGILFSSKFNSNEKAWYFFIVLIWTLIWAAILYFFCVSGNQAIAWFLLLLPIAVLIFWFISVFLAAATTAPQCVAGGYGVKM